VIDSKGDIGADKVIAVKVGQLSSYVISLESNGAAADVYQVGGIAMKEVVFEADCGCRIILYGSLVRQENIIQEPGIWIIFQAYRLVIVLIGKGIIDDQGIGAVIHVDGVDICIDKEVPGDSSVPCAIKTDCAQVFQEDVGYYLDTCTTGIVDREAYVREKVIGNEDAVTAVYNIKAVKAVKEAEALENDIPAAVNVAQ